jgi:hypothetical protein
MPGVIAVRRREPQFWANVSTVPQDQFLEKHFEVATLPFVIGLILPFLTKTVGKTRGSSHARPCRKKGKKKVETSGKWVTKPSGFGRLEKRGSTCGA